MNKKIINYGLITVFIHYQLNREPISHTKYEVVYYNEESFSLLHI